MDMVATFRDLDLIYQRYETEVADYKAGAACEKGCAFCCTHAGSIDATTQEGFRILTYLGTLPKDKIRKLNKAIRTEIVKREKKQRVSCPFLMKNKGCMIYKIRPFSCRRIYSAHTCTMEQPPAVHRQAMAHANTAIEALKEKDPNGYSGHLTYILFMLQTPAFYQTWMKGEFKPEEIMAFGKSHGIGINRL
ncbi:MAG: YkgJ family cysteine cluster protein [Desulfobacterales bacterium]|nr:YkgJ family cysteine cluster protein [Desulfobacterales bacterium]